MNNGQILGFLVKTGPFCKTCQQESCDSSDWPRFCFDLRANLNRERFGIGAVTVGKEHEGSVEQKVHMEQWQAESNGIIESFRIRSRWIYAGYVASTRFLGNSDEIG